MDEERVNEIVVPGHRWRGMHDIASLAESMKEIGLLHPITITSEKVLVSGLHRLRAAESLGWETIKASVLSGDELDAELAEIDENLISHRLTVAEQADHIARREALMTARGERAAGGGDRPSESDSNFDPVTVTGSKEKTTDDLAKEAGMSKSSYQKRSKIGRGLTAETKEIVSEIDPNDCDLPNSTRQLNYLAGIEDPDDQAEIARKVATGEAVSVWTASEKLKEEKGEEVGLEEMQKNWIDSQKEDDEQPLTITRIKKIGNMEYVVEWSDGKANTVGRKKVLEHGYSKCKHCAGYGVTPKKGS